MSWLLWTALLILFVNAEASDRSERFNHPGYYPSYHQPQPFIFNKFTRNAQHRPKPKPVIVNQVVKQPPQVIEVPPMPGPPAPPLGMKCETCTGSDCCDLCVERTCAAPEELSLLQLAINPFFHVKYVEDCPQARFLDNVCFLMVPLLDSTSLFTCGQIIAFKDGTVEQRQYKLEYSADSTTFSATGSGCKFKFEIIYSDVLCGVYVIQRCFETACCQIDSGPIQVVSTLLPVTQQCLSDALEFVKKLYPCKTFLELPQENTSVCTMLGKTVSPSH